MTISRRVTLFDIANALGISTGTVHRALHGNPDVNPMTRTRVLQMSKNMGYRPNMVARLLSQKKHFRVSVNTMASGSLAADLMGRFLNRKGKVAVTLSALAVTEHAEKLAAFEKTLKSLHSDISLVDPIEDHDVESEAYDKCRKLFAAHPDLAGIYVTTEASMPVVEAARDAQLLDRLTIIATDLFPG